MVEICRYDKILMNFFKGEEKTKAREDKRMVKLGFILFFQKCPFWTHILYKKINVFTFWCMVIPLGPHSIYT